MTVKEWLLRAKNIDDEINSLNEEAERAFSKATVRTRSTGGSTASPDNSTERKFINYAMYRAYIDERVEVLYKTKLEILAAIDKVRDNDLRLLLIKRYIKFKTFDKIAEEMHYSYVHIVHNLHPKALYAVGEFIKS